MSTRTLIGVAAPRAAYTARYLHHGEHPDTLVPLLRRMWTQTFARDTSAMAARLLERDWSSLAADPQPLQLPSGQPVVGVGWPAQGGAATPSPGNLRERIEGPLEWLYLIHPEWHLVEVYEATCHASWLRHSLHHLDPVEELFAIEPDPHSGGEPQLTVCGVCGAVDEIDHHELPSMLGYGLDTCTACRRCGSSVSTDPMFGAHVTRNPWPPPATPGAGAP